MKWQAPICTQGPELVAWGPWWLQEAHAKKVQVSPGAEPERSEDHSGGRDPGLWAGHESGLNKPVSQLGDAHVGAPEGSGPRSISHDCLQ